MMKKSPGINSIVFSVLILFLRCSPLVAQPPGQGAPGRGPVGMREEQELNKPFTGITTDGKIIPDLFPIKRTGVTTEPVISAANSFIASLTADQRSKTQFPVDDPEWRKWSNVDFYKRQGMGFSDMTDAQQIAAMNLLKASLSAKGLKLAWDIRHLNQTLGELTNQFSRLNEKLYWITIMGKPSATEPWGWQIDGHHLVINYMVVGDQVVMTPTFMGSEPVTATTGQYAGTSVLQSEQDQGLVFINTLLDEQRSKAILSSEKGRNNIQAEAFRDNASIPYVGIPGSLLDESQRKHLLELIAMYVDNMDEGHAKVKMEEVNAHISETYFAWIGETVPGSVFYYRIHSPVILIEFDHQGAIALREQNGGPGRGGATRQHIHTVVRTPNGNDYGKDLLREHYAKYPHTSNK